MILLSIRSAYKLKNVRKAFSPNFILCGHLWAIVWRTYDYDLQKKYKLGKFLTLHSQCILIAHSSGKLVCNFWATRLDQSSKWWSYFQRFVAFIYQDFYIFPSWLFQLRWYFVLAISFYFYCGTTIQSLHYYMNTSQ